MWWILDMVFMWWTGPLTCPQRRLLARSGDPASTMDLVGQAFQPVQDRQKCLSYLLQTSGINPDVTKGLLIGGER